ncbi:MAG: ABC transporter permease, partial [Solimonas sp.]
MNETFLILPAVLLAGFALLILLRRRAAGAGGRGFGFIERNGAIIATYLMVAVGFWVLMMIVLPQLYMVDFSFRNNLPPPAQGGPDDVHTMKNYRYLLFGPEGSDQAFNWLHLKIFAKTIVSSVLVTFLNFCLCYPIAYYIAQVARGGGSRLLFICLLIPFWVNEILRAFAFRIIFGTSGVLN